MSAEPDPQPLTASLWLETGRPAERPPLTADTSAEVAVLGAGIVGLSTALMLAREGVDVCLLEARRIGAGTTGHTTAKLTSLHALTYADLAGSHGEERARLYGEANEGGLAMIAALVEELAIDCDFGRKHNATYALDESDRGSIEEEVEVAARLGLPAAYSEELDLPFPIAAAVRFANQGEFHPSRYLAGLADAFEAADGRLHERSAAVAVDDGSPCEVRIAGGVTVRADRVIVATQMPFLDRGLFFALAHPHRSYCVSAPIGETLPNGAPAPAQMYISTESPAHSIRVHQRGRQRHLVLSGESHHGAGEDAPARFAALEHYARREFGIEQVEHRWAAHDFMPVDGMPMVGPLLPFADRILIATGFRKWGLAMGTAAARLLADRALGRENEWAVLFNPRRPTLLRAAQTLVSENAKVGFHFFADRVTRRGDGDAIGPGEGRVVGDRLVQRAVYRDEAGALHSLSARCTHLGCIVAWNQAEGSWDCPCHGSRFAVDGSVITGPAVAPLEPAELPASADTPPGR